MNKTLCRILLFALSLFLCLGVTACGDDAPTLPIDNIAFTELGIPTAERYPEGDMARCAWDMVAYDGKIYFGSGDYDVNKGPADIWCYDIENESWLLSGTVPDEEVSRFRFLGGALTAPGTDPKEDWALGNYYVLENGTWVPHRVLPGGIHNFDMVEYKGMLFAGMGVVGGEYPIARSTDGGEGFEQIEIRKDDAVLDTSAYTIVRCYDFFVLNGALYATLTSDSLYELYRYDDAEGCFVYHSDWKEKIKISRYKYASIGEKLTLGNTLYFTAGNLYVATDMKEPMQVSLPDGFLVLDLCIAEDTLYLLCAGKDAESGKIKTSVRRLESSEERTFTELFNFLYDVPPMSMVIEDGDFYIGMGNGRKPNEKNGSVLYIADPFS